ncbi:ATP-dependent protease subunit HslV [Helicobacter aurati]|uniref:ATP-dependent protease subunit HslV n=1 Tax=Helicobacter aurati TaxID=137778 RepID=A0A3D8J8E1_9HELI|nr:ATP-dependent protease subunit HslV [Helicobacter aurati]RDU73445.1 ATP-dependent protease subunit HslV [Helicobacter aurati]
MFHATTILGYVGTKNNKPYGVIGGDGQVSFGNCIMKGNANKIRSLYGGKILSGFAGSTADAFSLFDIFERILEGKKGDLLKSVLEFSNEWRKDKYLRKLEAMMVVLDSQHIYILSGTGDVLEPEDGKIAAIGSGGNFALSAARALERFADMQPRDLVLQSLQIAGEICIYTNTNIKILEITQ